MSRIYSRIFWLAKTLLVSEKPSSGNGKHEGKITLDGERESTMVRVVPHIFREMLRDDVSLCATRASQRRRGESEI